MAAFASAQEASTPLFLLDPDGLEDWLAGQPDRVQNWIRSTDFKAASASHTLVPGDTGGIQSVLVGLGNSSASERDRFALARIAPKLPSAAYRIETQHSGNMVEEQALGWLLSTYSFGRYAKKTPHSARLVCPEGVDAARLEAICAGEVLTRDLINTPASDMGPDDLEHAACDLAKTHGAQTNVIVGEALLEQNFSMIHTVGRAAARAPRLIDMSWGQAGPTLVLVGKGVCFDTGGLNIKPGASMGLMKKDMGGAATVLGLAHMIMALNLPLRLRVLIPAVENSIDGTAFRPQDVLTSRKGLSVEINNTDAEGRLVLADAIALADETPPDLMICMATLTGAARVALGPDLAPFYTDDPGFAVALENAAERVRDPVWRMPFHTPYEAMIEPDIADLDNAPKGGFAGSITAALFLRRFVTRTERFVHFDIYGWQPMPMPGRPKGGVGQGARAILDALPEVLGL
ncbi:MAG: leucyl aminopeptidase family protein [Pseudomonadota bacterium]